jgi:hypothetical protein
MDDGLRVALLADPGSLVSMLAAKGGSFCDIVRLDICPEVPWHRFTDVITYSTGYPGFDFHPLIWIRDLADARRHPLVGFLTLVMEPFRLGPHPCFGDCLVCRARLSGALPQPPTTRRPPAVTPASGILYRGEPSATHPQMSGCHAHPAPSPGARQSMHPPLRASRACR